jgi:energy-coupling factor transporter ATP-binding protein EcfA2
LSAAPRALLEVRGLTVRSPTRTLLAASSFDLHEGERALLVGPSGSGKSLFTDVLLGFLPGERPALEVTGSIRLDGVELVGAPVAVRQGRVGAVFQLQALGLFDDLTAERNLAFGARDAERATALAAGLGLRDLGRPASLLSGGERVRTALARTLLSGADVLVADEPTTGLDAASATQVVAALRAAHRRLTLVVTHDEAAFGGFADATLVIDPATHTLRRLPGGADGTGTAPGGPGAPPAGAGRSFRLAAAWARGTAATADALLDLLSLVLLPRTLLHAVHPLHGPRVRRALARETAPGVAVFVGLSALLVALTATFFLFERLPRREFSEPLLQQDLVAGLGVVLTRVAVPLIASILLAAKLGASAAAHLGHMSLTRQVDALRLLGVSPRTHLLHPTALGMLVAAWLHTAIAVGIAFVTTTAVFLWQHPGWSALYARTAWAASLRPEDVLWIAAKVGASALAVALTAYRVGTAPKRAPEHVLLGIHRTLLLGLILVLAVHAAFAFVEF